MDRENRVTTLVPGKARGRLLGGNLCLMAHLWGTPYFPDLHGAILFLEDVEEAYYRIDRMLTQLWLSGALAGVAGVAFGKFTNCDPSPFFLQNRPLEDILAERGRALGVPPSPASWSATSRIRPRSRRLPRRARRRRGHAHPARAGSELALPARAGRRPPQLLRPIIRCSSASGHDAPVQRQEPIHARA